MAANSALAAASSHAGITGVDAYRSRPALQQPTWPDAAALARAVAQLEAAKPIVAVSEITRLKAALADVATGNAFVLQGGDCAETFVEANASRVRNKLRTMLQMAVILMHGSSLPIVKIGRMGGQYAKPRSDTHETRDGVTLPVYRGDMVNSHEFTEAARNPDPTRLLRAYEISAATANVIQAFTTGGYANLRQVHAWNRGFMGNPTYARYEQTAAEIDRAIAFMAAAGADSPQLKTTEFYLSHEALILDYERALTRLDIQAKAAFDTSAHMLWVGERTRQPDGAHVEFLANIANPVGVKLGPGTEPATALQLATKLNPNNEPGRLTFIVRMGAGQVRERLPAIVAAITNAGHRVTWMTDPMHGNTITSENGYKTRRFADVVDEVRGFFEVHRAAGTIPGGLHMELTGDDVTEVIGGSGLIDEAGLTRRYETLVDPRLNHEQSLEIAFLVGEMLAAG